MMPSFFSRVTSYSVAALAVCATSTIFTQTAQAEEDEAHVDAFLLVGPNGKIRTGGYDFEDNIVDNVNTFVYEGEFDQFGTTDEPGFNSLSSTNPQLPAGFSTLPGNTSVVWTGKAFTIGGVTSNLWHWDGTGPVDFDPLTDGTVLNIGKAPFNNETSADLDGSANDVAGFEIETTNSSGFLHKHINFSVVDVNSAPTGFYLWSLVLTAGNNSSDPIYFVHDLGETGEVFHELAAEWVEDNLATSVIPAPTSAFMALGGLAGLMLRRRR